MSSDKSGIRNPSVSDLIAYDPERNHVILASDARSGVIQDTTVG